ncbi:hypothetical protein ACLB2K_047132 [Fragaria x ananassa]
MQSKDKEGTRAKGTKDDQNRIELLSWFEMSEGVVATAKLDSKDPNAMVHHVPLGPECWKVWVLDVFDDIALYRPTKEFGTLSEATGGHAIVLPVASSSVPNSLVGRYKAISSKTSSTQTF